MVLDVSFSSELASCFTSNAARNLLKESDGKQAYDDTETVPSTAAPSLDGDNYTGGDIESQRLSKLKFVYPYDDQEQEEEDDAEDMWNVTESSLTAREKKAQKKKKKQKKKKQKSQLKKVSSVTPKPQKVIVVEKPSDEPIVKPKDVPIVKPDPQKVIVVEKPSDIDTSLLKAIPQQPPKSSSPVPFVADVNPETESRSQEHLRDAHAAQKRLDALRGSTDTRDHVTLWNEQRYCHRMFRHRAQVDYPSQTCIELWDNPEQMTLSKTYSEIHHGAESIARWVSAACAETTTKNRAICVYLPRGYELIASVIGIWYGGACVNVTDTKLPWERLEFIAGDASAAMIITTEELCGENPNSMPCPVLNVNAIIANGTAANKGPIWLSDSGLAGGVVVPDMGEVSDENIDDDDACVCIYTSGSTGNPKGVRLQYKAFSNYACIEQCLTLPSPQDRIVQTQSLSFIAGYHECWRGLTSGATLVLANSGVTGLGPDLEGWLRDRDISIMKAVPSLLRSMMIGDRKPELPKLRLLHIGGEAVTQDLVDCFGEGRLFLNTYGSTESCSNCVIGFCAPGDEHCTIGKALPSFKGLVLENSNSTEEVTTGVLHIGGMSLALDYLNLPEKTKEVFIEHPKFGRLYNTGDVVERLEGSGNLIYRGRTDNQTKINGYRVELGEVEAKMNMIDIVKESAAVAVEGSLYAFVSFPEGSDYTLTIDELKDRLKELALPFFAMPSRLTIVDKFPKTISGKLDRKVLKQQIQDELDEAKNAGDKYDQGTVLGVLMAAFGEVLRTPVEPNDDFFTLGGDSASAGQTVGMIRYKGEAMDLPNISILDLYTHRTPKNLEEHIIRLTTSGEAFVDDIFRSKRMHMQDSPRPRLFEIVSFFVAMLLMFIDGIEVFFYFIIIWASDFAIPVTQESTVIIPKFTGIFDVAWSLFLIKIIFYGVWIALTVIVKWTVIGRYREGRWAKYGPMHLRHWIVVRVSSHLPWRLIGGTGVNKLVMKILGAKVGKGTFTFFEPASGTPMAGYDLYELEDFSSICQGAYCSPIYFTEDSMVCGRIHLGRSSSLYPRSTVSGTVRLEEGAVLDTLSNATDGAVLGAWEKWSGSPATPSGEAGDRVVPPQLRSANEFFLTIAQLFDIFFGYYVVLCISMLPRYGLLVYLHSVGQTIVSPGVFIANVVAAIFFGALALTFFSIIFVRTAAFFFPSKPGVSHVCSWTTFVLWHKLFWFKSPQLMLNNTRFLQWFARAAGMNLGAGSHISNVKGCIPDLITIGTHTFLANPCFLGVPIVHNCMFHVGTVTIGDNVLVGNNSCFPINTSVPSDTTIAVNTGAPPDDAPPGGVWVGNPPVRITDNVTVPYVQGSMCDKALMFTSEVLIIFIPGTLWALTILTWLYLFVYIVFTLDTIHNIVWQTAFGSMLLIPLRAIWAIIGGLLVRVIQSGFTRTPVEKNVGYWHSLCYRWRIYNKVWAFFLIPMLLDDFSGCMWMNRIIRLLTMAEIEENVLIVHHGLFKDHDYIKVRKGATINESVILRTHSFEDWRLKFGFVEIGPRTVIYPCSTVMFGSVTAEDCTIISNSLVLKGDELAAGTITAGIPSVPVKNREPENAEYEEPFTPVKSSKAHRNILIACCLILFVAVNLGIAAVIGTVIARRNVSQNQLLVELLLHHDPIVPTKAPEEQEDAPILHYDPIVPSEVPEKKEDVIATSTTPADEMEEIDEINALERAYFRGRSSKTIPKGVDTTKSQPRLSHLRGNVFAFQHAPHDHE